jgi:hypothetical protein
LITKVAADAIQEGQYLAYQGMAGRTFEPEFEKEPAVASSAPVEERRGVQLSKEEQAYLGAVESGPTGEPAEATEQEQATADTSATWAAPAAPAETEAQTHPDATGAEAAESEVLEAEMDSVLEDQGGSSKERSEAGADAPAPEEDMKPGEEYAGAEESTDPDRTGQGS